MAGCVDRGGGVCRRCRRVGFDGQDEGPAGDAAGARASDREREGGRAMGQDQGTDSAPVRTQREPEEIRQDIEATRSDLGDTVAALAEKADVKAQAQQRVQEVKGQAQDTVTGAKEAISSKATEMSSKAKQASPDTVASVAADRTRRVRERPMPLVLAPAFAA